MNTSFAQSYTDDDLQKVQLFKSADISTIDGLLRKCPVTSLAKGQPLISSGQPNETVYLVLSGSLRVLLDDTDEEPVVILQGGESVGEMSVIDNQLTSAAVIAETDCRLLAINEETLWTLVAQSPTVARNLLHSLSRRLRHSNAMLRRQRRQQKKYAEDAITDSLSGLYNRRWIDEALPREVDRCAQRGWPLSLLIADIDHFKSYNDTHGHLAGDQAIQSTAETIRNSVRQADMVARFGGEEFLVLLPRSDIPHAAMIAGRILQAVKTTSIRHTDGRPLPPVTISIGLAQHQPGQDPQSLIEKADAALFRAKKQGRNGISQ